MHWFDDAEAGRVTRRAPVTVLNRHRTRKGEVLVVELTLQACDICGTVHDATWDFLIGGEQFTFCSKHRHIGARHHGEVAHESDQPTLF